MDHYFHIQENNVDSVVIYLPIQISPSLTLRTLMAPIGNFK